MSAVDLRPLFEQWGLGVRRQGERGTCSVFTLADATACALAARRGGEAGSGRRPCRPSSGETAGTEAGRYSGHEDGGALLSVEFLNWAANQVREQPGDGGCFSELWAGYEARGICPESEMPYEPALDLQRGPSPSARERAAALRGVGLQLHWLKAWDPTCGVNDAQLAEIKRTLAGHVPVCGGFLWPKADPVYPGGILEMPPREAMRDGHSVLLVGYTDDAAQPGGGLLIFRNTSKGYPGASMTYAYAQAYMNDAAWIR